MTKNNPHSQIDRPQRQDSEVIHIPAGTDEVVCDGGVGALGHPQVWYTFDHNDQAACYYCGRKFIRKPA